VLVVQSGGTDPGSLPEAPAFTDPDD
jgi:hypothetical protein